MNRILIKKASSPLTTLAIGAALGAGAGELTDFIHSKITGKKRKKSLKAPIIGALIGAIPGISKAVYNYSNSRGDMGFTANKSLNVLDPLTMDIKDLKEKSPIVKYRVNSLIDNYGLIPSEDLPEY